MAIRRVFFGLLRGKTSQKNIHGKNAISYSNSMKTNETKCIWKVRQCSIFPMCVLGCTLYIQAIQVRFSVSNIVKIQEISVFHGRRGRGDASPGRGDQGSKFGDGGGGVAGWWCSYTYTYTYST